MNNLSKLYRRHCFRAENNLVLRLARNYPILKLTGCGRNDGKCAASLSFIKRLENGARSLDRTLSIKLSAPYLIWRQVALKGVSHRQQEALNHSLQNSAQPFGSKRDAWQLLKSAGKTQRFLSAYLPIASYFGPRRHVLTAQQYCQSIPLVPPLVGVYRLRSSGIRGAADLLR